MPAACSRLYRLLLRRWPVALLFMGLGSVLFGPVSLNLIHLLSANFEFLSEHGADAVREGAPWQLAGLVLSGYAAAACCIVFKLREKVLAPRLSTDHNKE